MKPYEEFIKGIFKLGCLSILFTGLLIFAWSTGLYLLGCALFDWTFHLWIAIILWIVWSWIFLTM